ncbi:MAG: LemA family protein [Hyphomonas sp.]|jgi:LemA protein|nr:LemA family protein [Hyphomonas sp.]
MTPIYVVLGILVVLLAFVIILFNQLVGKRNMVDNGWADIDVQLKRRADLIPQLVTTVQAYASHERQLFEDVIMKRNAALQAGDHPGARGSKESALAAPVGKLIALAEDYPDLKANENFKELQTELAETENKIEMARRFYNGAVREMNVAVESFPGNLIAGMFGFARRHFFEIQMSDRAIPEIDLGGAD